MPKLAVLSNHMTLWIILMYNAPLGLEPYDCSYEAAKVKELTTMV
jgi:hypothetical protein